MIIGISGKKQSGKDTVGKIIQYLIMIKDRKLQDYPYTFQEALDRKIGIGVNNYTVADWQVKKFADKLKDIVCLLLNCTRDQLEDEVFKSTELGEEWDIFKVHDGSVFRVVTESYYLSTHKQKFIEKLTPRKLLQLLGTECGRQIIHPNIWVNSLMSEYKPALKQEFIEPSIKSMFSNYTGICDMEGCNSHWTSLNKYNSYCKKCNLTQPDIFPNWIITDTRFPNEAKAIKDRSGIVIRVNSDRCNNKDTHPSEIALDRYKEFDYTIDNNGTIDELIDKVREILTKEKLL